MGRRFAAQVNPLAPPNSRPKLNLCTNQYQLAPQSAQAEAEQVFFNEPLLIVDDAGHSSYELRLHPLGHTDAGRLLHISFTLRGNGSLIRVVSARTMQRKERIRYEQENEQET
jgi:uncharacterized protein